MTITPDDLVRREVFYCVSSLISTLAQGAGIHDSSAQGTSLAHLAYQALDLAISIENYEEAAREHGWIQDSDGTIIVDGDPDGSRVDSWYEACQHDNIEPYEREVFEHWVVSDWLADKLADKGEKVDKDFAGMTIWARTTTGQGIASDYVIESICDDLNRA